MMPRFLGLQAFRLALKTRSTVLFVTSQDQQRGIIGRQPGN